MNLGQPSIETRTTHRVVIPIEDHDVAVADTDSRGRPSYYRPSRLTIAYTDGVLDEVVVSGDRVKGNGERHANGGGHRVWYLPRRYSWEKGNSPELIADTPQWIRDAVAAHPWPAGR